MPAITRSDSTATTQRRARGRVTRSAGSRVSESIMSLDASPDVASYRQGYAARHQPRAQARELILDRPGGRYPAATQRLVQIEQGLEFCQTHLRKIVLRGEQGGLGL